MRYKLLLLMQQLWENNEKQVSLLMIRETPGDLTPVMCGLQQCVS